MHLHWIGWVIIFAMAAGLAIVALSITRRDIVSAKVVGRKSAQSAIRVRYTPGPVLRLRGIKPYERLYLGSGYFWKEHGVEHRCDKELSEWLNKQWLKHRHQGR